MTQHFATRPRHTSTAYSSYRARYFRPRDVALPTCETIRQYVCEVYGIVDLHLDSRSRQKTLVEARHVAMWFMRLTMQMSYPEIARQFAGRDHTTIMHAVKHIERDRDKPLVAARLAAVATKLSTTDSQLPRIWEPKP